MRVRVTSQTETVEFASTANNPADPYTGNLFHTTSYNWLVLACGPAEDRTVKCFIIKSPSDPKRQGEFGYWSDCDLIPVKGGH